MAANPHADSETLSNTQEVISDVNTAYSSCYLQLRPWPGSDLTEYTCSHKHTKYYEKSKLQEN